MTTIHKLSFKDTTGREISLGKFKDKVILIVNTATKCGLAPQFEGLEQLHQDYKDKGLVVIGFPCDQFAGQEPETNETMVQVCQLNFGVTFQLSEKINVNGPNTHPIFKYLKDHSKSALGKDIKWNFTKFLVSRDGRTIKRFAPTTEPEAMRQSIEKLLT
ncbi:MAG TPA: glutathione peroxidase [Candidatus Saccharibacteria bacterium]|nr:glutathione peroxidase [Candidatus Saccharibacteria bacterium]